MKILFISYHFHPSNLVGAKRVSYWAKNLEKFSKRKIHTSLVTTQNEALNQNPEIDNIFIVEPVKELSQFRIDAGSEWYYNLKPFLLNHLQNSSYDYCIITGNPFGHFLIIKELKRFKIKTLLDFRDPFAVNPRSRFTLKSKVKSILLSFLEYYFIANTHKSIVVNKYCIEHIRFRRFLTEKIEIIDNGFDETILYNTQTKELNTRRNQISLAYSGSIFKDRDPKNLIKVIQQYSDSLEFHLIGNINNIYKAKNVVLHGLLSYEENLKLLQKKDILVVLATGHQFESSTKVFDYIALKKPIMVIFNEWQGKGALFDILNTYPLAVFSKNTIEDIEISIDKIINSIDTFKSKIVDYDVSKFSRKNGLLTLLNLLNED